MRRHPPQLVRPSDVVSAATDRSLGIRAQRSPDQRMSAVERIIAQHDGEIAREAGSVTAARERIDDLAELVGGPGGPPDLELESAAGSTAAVTEFNGNDEAGVFTIEPGGSGITSDTVLTVTFAQPRSDPKYHISLTPLSAAARTVGWAASVGSRSSTGWTLFTDVALTSGAEYRWSYALKAW